MVDATESQVKWKYVIVLTKFIIQFVEVGMVKSFGVLIPTMVEVFSADVSTLGLVCSMPTSMMLLSSLPMAYVLKSGRISARSMAVIGAVISSAGIIIAGFLQSVIVLGFCLAVTGIGLSMGYLPVKILLNEHFHDRFVFVNAIGNLGSTAGAMIAPIIIERSLSAYGYNGAMLILGGISLHGVVASTTLRTVKDPPKYTRIDEDKKDAPCQEIQMDLPSNSEVGHYVNNNAESEDGNLNHESLLRKKSDNDEAIPRMKRFLDWCQHCTIVKEPLLLLSLPCRFIISFVIQAWFLFLVPKAEWRGIPSSKAVLLSSIGGGAGIVGRFISIVLLYFRADFIVVFFILSLVSSVTFLIDPLLTSFPAMSVTSFVQGFYIFSSSTSSNAFLKASVSDERFTLAAGMYGFAQGLGANIGSLLSGMIKDKTGSYSTVFFVLGLINCVTVVLTVSFMVARRKRDVTNDP